MSEELNKALVKACETGDLDQVTRYLVQGADVNYIRQPFGWTPLTAALFNNKNQAVVSLLLDQVGLDVDKPNSGNITPLHMACDTENTEAIQKILDISLESINVKTNSGCTPLMIAAAYGKVSAVKIMLGVPGVDLNTRNHRRKSLEDVSRTSPQIINLIQAAKGRTGSCPVSKPLNSPHRNLQSRSSPNQNHEYNSNQAYNGNDRSEFPALTPQRGHFQENECSREPSTTLSSTRGNEHDDRCNEKQDINLLEQADCPKNDGECSVCLQDMISPPKRILQCIKGHHTCGDCRKSISSCSVCAEQFQWRAVEMEQFVRSVKRLSVSAY